MRMHHELYEEDKTPGMTSYGYHVNGKCFQNNVNISSKSYDIRIMSATKANETMLVWMWDQLFVFYQPHIPIPFQRQKGIGPFTKTIGITLY